jgi:RNA polymerase sigma-70 factor (ECF subfamily)
MSEHGATGCQLQHRRLDAKFGDVSLSASEPVDRHRNDGAAHWEERQESYSIRQLYEQHVATIYRFIYSKVGTRETAEDLTAQVFIKASDRLDRSRRRESIQGWLFQVARTVVADHWRAFYRLRTDSLETLVAAGWDMSAAQEMAEPASPSAARVERILGQLPARYREVLTYRFLRDCSIRETAEQMRLTEYNVKVLQYRALKKAAALDPNLV